MRIAGVSALHDLTQVQQTFRLLLGQFPRSDAEQIDVTPARSEVAEGYGTVQIQREADSEDSG